MHHLIQEDIPLAPFTTMKVGGPAKRFCDVTTEEELTEVLILAKDSNWPVFILSGGSNVIFSDDGFDGMVIKNEISFLEKEDTKVKSGAATEMSKLVDATIDAGLSGLEWAGGLPGTLGGAIRGNAGAFGGEIKDSVTEVRSVDVVSGKISVRNNKDCLFEYRGSYFKKTKEVIISAILQMKKGDKEELRKIADDHIAYRNEKHPMDLPNSGSIFKNTPLDKVPAKYLPVFENVIKKDPFPVVPTAAIIAEAGLAGFQVGQAQVSEKHTNYIVNLGSAKASEIIELINTIKERVKEKYDIELMVEPEIVQQSENTNRF